MKYIFSRPFHAHDYVKNQVLDFIESSNVSSIGDNVDSISKTDFFEASDSEYKSFLLPHLSDHFLKTINQPKFNIKELWFQQYNKNDSHSWHVHENSHFTNVYFLELPNNQYKTEIQDLNGDIINIEVEEGHILTFPAFLYHRSPLIDDDIRKTIVSFNVDLLS